MICLNREFLYSNQYEEQHVAFEKSKPWNFIGSNMFKIAQKTLGERTDLQHKVQFVLQ